MITTLNKQKAQLSITIEWVLEFFSLNFNLKIYNKHNQFDYFFKWSSSLLKLNDLIIKNYFDNGNKNKNLVEPVNFIDYLVFDVIFFNYNINEKKKFFYFFKNKFLLNFFFKLSKKDKLKFKYYLYFYVYNNNFLLNKNYHLNFYLYNCIMKEKKTQLIEGIYRFEKFVGHVRQGSSKEKEKSK